MNNKGQFSIIAALLVAVVLIATVIITYSTIRNSPIQDQPQLLSAIDETNFAIKQILGFTVGYYGSVLKVTGNLSYAKTLALNYLRSGLVNIASMHPEWGASFSTNTTELNTYWFTNTSYSRGNLAVTYNLAGLGIYGITYETSCRLVVQIGNTVSNNQTKLTVTEDEEEPLINLGSQNFKFYRYRYADSTWELVTPSIEPTAFANGTYIIDIPQEVDPYSYLIQVEDQRGLIAVASSFSRYTCALTWNSTYYSKLQDATIVVELLQNGTMRWLGQNLQFTTQTKPIPPIPVKAIHVNQTINSVNREVPFQVEDWASKYRIPLGLANNASVFGSRTLLAFLVNPNVSETTIWWDGHDNANQTSYAWRNRYFNDDPYNGVLSNGDLTLNIGKSTEYLYVNSFSWSRAEWVEVGNSPFLHDTDSSYIWDDDDYNRERYFYFEDLSVGSGDVESVKIQFETLCDGNDYFQFAIRTGWSWYGWYSITGLSSSYGWKEYDVSSILTSLSRVNDARIEIRYRRSGSGSSDVFIRRCRLVVEVDFSNFMISSTVGSSIAEAEFFRINGENPVYGADPSYAIYNGSVRDIVHQESEWSGGINNCPNLYAHIVLTLPANSTYYTYQLRLMFAESQQDRTITDLCPVKLTTSSGLQQTENGTTSGYPIISNVTGLYYNSSASSCKHHWSQFISGAKGAGTMFTDTANQMLYFFDVIAGNETGALKVSNSTERTIEILPVTIASIEFQYALDVTWHGAIVTFDETTPIYKQEDGNKTGLWIIVEYPPTITVTTES